MWVINHVLHPFIEKFMVVYLDDILMYSTYQELRMQHLSEVLLALKTVCTHCNKQMCFLDKESIVFWICSVKGWYIRWSIKSECYSRVATTNYFFAIRSFHGLASFERRFVPLVNTILALIIDCMKRRTIFLYRSIY